MAKNELPRVSVVVKPSIVDRGGVGIFASHEFKKGEIIGRPDTKYRGVFLTWREVASLGKEIRSLITKYCIGNRDGVWSPLDFDYIPAIWNINHNCDYNTGFDENDNFIAVRHIKTGEEICLDYGLAISNPSFYMRCTCGSQNCRKTVTGNDWQQFLTNESIRRYMMSNLKNYSSSMSSIANVFLR